MIITRWVLMLVLVLDASFLGQTYLVYVWWFFSIFWYNLPIIIIWAVKPWLSQILEICFKLYGNSYCWQWTSRPLDCKPMNHNFDIIFFKLIDKSKESSFGLQTDVDLLFVFLRVLFVVAFIRLQLWTIQLDIFFCAHERVEHKARVEHTIVLYHTIPVNYFEQQHQTTISFVCVFICRYDAHNKIKQKANAFHFGFRYEKAHVREQQYQQQQRKLRGKKKKK